MATRGGSVSTPNEDLLAQAGQRSAQLAARLRADAEALSSPELADAADALKRCGDAAQRLSELLTASQETTE